jgi:hypothetical protein
VKIAKIKTFLLLFFNPLPLSNKDLTEFFKFKSFENRDYFGVLFGILGSLF